MNFKKLIFLSFITPFIEPLNLNYYIQTNLNNYGNILIHYKKIPSMFSS